MRTTVSSPKKLKMGHPSSSSFTWTTWYSPVVEDQAVSTSNIHHREEPTYEYGQDTKRGGERERERDRHKNTLYIMSIATITTITTTNLY